MGDVVVEPPASKKDSLIFGRTVKVKKASDPLVTRERRIIQSSFLVVFKGFIEFFIHLVGIKSPFNRVEYFSIFNLLSADV